jgi:hypothetical protein
VRNDCFWLAKDVSMLEEELVFLSKEGIQKKGFNNLRKRRMSCRDRALSSSLQSEGFNLNEKINDMTDGTLEDEPDGYMCNISNNATNDDILRRTSIFMNESTNEERNDEEEQE